MMGQSDCVLPTNFRGDRRILARGEGVYLYDRAGNRYLDAIGGVGVVNIGHAVPEIVEAITRQAGTLAFSYGSHFENQPRQQLASLLNEWAPVGMRETKTQFYSGGAEANEAAVKLAYQYHWERGDRSKRKIIGRWQSYHGNTLGALSIGGRTSWRRMFDPLLFDTPHIHPPYCYRCPWGLSPEHCSMQCVEELKREILHHGPENIAAFIAEPVIGTSMSAVVPPPGYYQGVRALCDEFNVLFLADEVMSGVGRTGNRWGIDHWGVAPDILVTAKGIAGGYAPLSAVVLSETIWRAIENGSGKVTSSSTYGGMPVSCAAGVAVLQYIDEHDLIARAKTQGAKLALRLQEELGDLPWVGEIRGIGLFLGIEIVSDRTSKKPFPFEMDVTHRIEDEAFKLGLLVLGGAPGLIDGACGDHLELLPPYTIDDGHIDFIARTLRRAVELSLSDIPKQLRS